MKAIFLILTLLSFQAIAAEKPVETDPRLHSDGKGWKLNQATNKDPKRPRVLLIGDSILSGYMAHAIKALDGKAYVDAWVNPYNQSQHLNDKILPEVLAKGPYDVVFFNMGLHGWPEGRIKPGTFEPLTKGYVEVIKAKLPNAKIIWASSTPVLLEGEVKKLDPVINANIVEQNRMAAKVMAECGVPVSDFYALLVDKLGLARGGKDKFHWNAPAYKILGDKCVEAVLKALPTADDPFQLHQDVSFLGPDRAEKMDIYLPLGGPRPLPVVLYIHGGAWGGGDKAWAVEKPNCVALAREGYAVASINYKLNPKGTSDAYPQNVFDCKTAIRFLRREAATYGFDAQRIAVAGGSAGGHLAMLLAYTPAVSELNQGGLYPEYPVNASCVIDLFGIADVRLWGKHHFVPRSRIDTDEGRRTLEVVSPIVHVNATTVPTLVIHGTNDQIVPFSQAEDLVKRLKEHGVPHRFIRVEHGGHAFPFTPHVRNKHSNLMPAVTAFLQEHLKK